LRPLYGYQISYCGVLVEINLKFIDVDLFKLLEAETGSEFLLLVEKGSHPQG
jgi:hypothetical protein